MKGGVHAAMSPRKIIMGKKLQVPKYKIGEYFQGHIKTTNDAGEERSVKALYLGLEENRYVHIVFKF